MNRDIALDRALDRIAALPRWAEMRTQETRQALDENNLSLSDTRIALRLLDQIGEYDEDLDLLDVLMACAGEAIATTRFYAAHRAIGIMLPGHPLLEALKAAISRIVRRIRPPTCSQDRRSLDAILNESHWTEAERVRMRDAVSRRAASMLQVRAVDRYLRLRKDDPGQDELASFMAFAEDHRTPNGLWILQKGFLALYGSGERMTALEEAKRLKARQRKPPTKRRDCRPIDEVLAHPRWSAFDPDQVRDAMTLGRLSNPDIRIMDRFLAHAGEHLPNEGTIAEDTFLEFNGTRTSTGMLRQLRRVLATLTAASPILRELDKACLTIERGRRPAQEKDLRSDRRLTFSVRESELPTDWQEVLADMRRRFPGETGAAPVPSMVKSVATKLREVAKVASDAGMPAAMSPELLGLYERSLLTRERPLRETTICSALKRLLEFAQYVGLDSQLIDHLKQRIGAHEKRAARETPLKEAKATRLPSYAELFGMAFDKLGEADEMQSPRDAQCLRNEAAALAIFSPFPLRSADSQLHFGTHVTWTGEAYRLYVPETSKTGVPVGATLLPFFGMFIDHPILQGSTADHLEELRERCMRVRRPLFMKHDDSTPHANYVSYVWERVVGTGSHIARTKIHDEFAIFGARGVELALRACTHRSTRSAEVYRTRAFAMLASDYVHTTLAHDIAVEEWEEHFGRH